MYLNKIKRKLGCRQLRVYCLGAAKTGTTSFAGMFAEGFRSAHEPNVPDLTQRVIEYHQGKLTDDEAKKWLISRDADLKLDIEASHPLGYMAPLLAEIYPEAKFVITIREPKAWLHSRLDFHKIKQPAEWEKYRNYIWAKGHTVYSPEESVLKELGLFSLDGYLSQYAEQYKILFEALPSERTLIIKTSELNNSIGALSALLNISERKIQVKHMNKVDDKLNLLDQLDSAFVNKKIAQHCSFIKKYI